MKVLNCDLQLNSGWLFYHGKINKYYDTMAQNCKAGGHLGNLKRLKNENDWQSVSVPHDWVTVLPYDKNANAWSGSKFRGEGWYYLEVDLPNSEIENATLVFEGVMGKTQVFVNGCFVGRNESGYNKFWVDVSCYLVPNQVNVIVLYVDATSWEAWSYEGAGLYRPCYIKFRKNLKIDTDNCFVKSVYIDKNWQVVADIKIENPTDSAVLISTIFDNSGEIVYETTSNVSDSVKFIADIKNAKLWSPENPYLYKLVCKLLSNGEVIDTFSSNVGLKNIVWDKDNGMLLNGQKYQIKGICCHQDHGGVGIAVTPEIIKYRILKLKELGVNAYRCAHHSVSEDLYEICDNLGMLVMAENRHYSVNEDALKQLESLVKVARNHPSVFIYSLFNEEPLQGSRTGYLLAKKMREHILRFDDSRAVTGAMENGIIETLNASDALDVVGANYGNQNYQKYHALHPNKAVLGTENCPTFATRGVYKTDSEKQVYDSYGEYFPGFTLSLTDTMISVLQNDFCAGCFAWSGFDSYGEPQPYAWPSIMSHWGFMDICGFEKDTAYLLKAWYKSDLLVHLLPHWNWENGDIVKVCAFTNADSCELFHNGKSLGEKQVVNRRVDWQVNYQPGEIKVIARRGNLQVTDTVYTAGKASKIVLQDVTPKYPSNKAKIINIFVVDKSGTIVPNFNETLHFSGDNVIILGVANGNPNGTQNLVDSKVPCFNGKAQLIVKANSAKVKVSADGLEGAEI